MLFHSHSECNFRFVFQVVSVHEVTVLRREACYHISPVSLLQSLGETYFSVVSIEELFLDSLKILFPHLNATLQHTGGYRKDSQRRVQDRICNC